MKEDFTPEATRATDILCLDLLDLQDIDERDRDRMIEVIRNELDAVAFEIQDVLKELVAIERGLKTAGRLANSRRFDQVHSRLRSLISKLERQLEGEP